MTAYGVSPLYTAYAIREAVKTNDTDYLRHRISWTPVRQTLRTSMVEIALGPEAHATTERAANVSWWSRMKTAYGKAMVERLVDRYANPEGFGSLFTYGRSVRRNILLRRDPDEGLTTAQKVAAMWSRIRRAEFISMSRFEIDLVDKYDANRMYAGVLEFDLHKLGWTLTELRVLQDSERVPAASSA
ncbi:MAG: DUF2939 domain-containing protein [Pseudomonadota bacterium]